VQAVSADVDQATRRSETPALPSGVDLLIENAERQECRKGGDEDHFHIVHSPAGWVAQSSFAGWDYYRCSRGTIAVVR
jgi:hypothetical protein